MRFLSAQGNLPEALRKGFLALDEQMRSDDEMRDDVSGATAVVVLVKDDVIHCGESFHFLFNFYPFFLYGVKRKLLNIQKVQ